MSAEAVKNPHVIDKSMKYTKEIDDLIYLLACAVNQTKPDSERVNSMQLELIYRWAQRHSVTALAASALEKTIELPEVFEQAKKKSIRRLALFDIERGRIYAQLNKEKIWHMSLKGIILKEYYPAFGLREMSDNDILCDADRMDDIKRIMETLGFQCTVFDERVDDTYVKAPVSFEMHRNLFDERESELFHLYYKDIKSRLLPDNKVDYEYRFTPEDFYLYMIAHEYKHYILGGTGLRSLLDIYVYLQRWNNKLDWEYIRRESDKLKISEFEEKTKALSKVTFSGASLGDTKKEELIYYISSGTFGTSEHALSNHIATKLSGDDSKKAKKQYLKDRLFMTPETMRKNYPFFYRHKILIPFLHIYRFLRAVFVRRNDVLHEYQKVKDFDYSEKDYITRKGD